MLDVLLEAKHVIALSGSPLPDYTCAFLKTMHGKFLSFPSINAMEGNVNRLNEIEVFTTRDA